MRREEHRARAGREEKRQVLPGLRLQTLPAPAGEGMSTPATAAETPAMTQSQPGEADL